MSQTITGTSGGGYVVDVNAQGEMRVTAQSGLAAAALQGRAYTFFASETDIDTGDTTLLVRNNASDKNLIVDKVTISNGNVTQCVYDLHIVTASFTAAGTVAGGGNLNAGYAASTADITALADETGNTQGTVIMEYRALVADTYYDLNDLGIVLPSGTAFGIDQINESDSGGAQLWCYFVDA